MQQMEPEEDENWGDDPKPVKREEIESDATQPSIQKLRQSDDRSVQST